MSHYLKRFCPGSLLATLRPLHFTIAHIAFPDIHLSINISHSLHTRTHTGLIELADVLRQINGLFPRWPPQASPTPAHTSHHRAHHPRPPTIDLWNIPSSAHRSLALIISHNRRTRLHSIPSIVPHHPNHPMTLVTPASHAS